MWNPLKVGKENLPNNYCYCLDVSHITEAADHFFKKQAEQTKPGPLSVKESFKMSNYDLLAIFVNHCLSNSSTNAFSVNIR